MASDDRPVALFDSGVGGLAVLDAVHRLLPHEDLLYFADSAHFPYGARRDDDIRRRSEEIVSGLLERGARLIVVACNTATGAAIEYLRHRFPVPFVGVEPGVKPAVEASRNGRVAVLATESTAAGDRLAGLVERFAEGAAVEIIPAPDLTNAIERGETDWRPLLDRYLAPVRHDGIDTVVLGCTHYGLVRHAVQEVVGPTVRVVDTAEPVARRVAQVLGEQGLGAGGSRRGCITYLTSGDEERFAAVRERLQPLLPNLP